MPKIKRLDIRIRRSDDTGIFHNSREDVRMLSETMNILIVKQNEVIEVVNRLIELQEKR